MNKMVVKLIPPSEIDPSRLYRPKMGIVYK
jgi:hypothetical protein